MTKPKRMCDTCKYFEHCEPAHGVNAGYPKDILSIARVFYDVVPEVLGICTHAVEGRHHVLRGWDESCKQWEYPKTHRPAGVDWDDTSFENPANWWKGIVPIDDNWEASDWCGRHVRNTPLIIDKEGGHIIPPDMARRMLDDFKKYGQSPPPRKPGENRPEPVERRPLPTPPPPPPSKGPAREIPYQPRQWHQTKDAAPHKAYHERLCALEDRMKDVERLVQSINSILLEGRCLGCAYALPPVHRTREAAAKCKKPWRWCHCKDSPAEWVNSDFGCIHYKAINYTKHRELCRL